MTFAILLTVVSILWNSAPVVKNDYCGIAAQRCSLSKELEPSLRIELIDKAAHWVRSETADKFNEAALRYLKP